jgi:hypothetical protein
MRMMFPLLWLEVGRPHTIGRRGPAGQAANRDECLSGSLRHGKPRGLELGGELLLLMGMHEDSEVIIRGRGGEAIPVPQPDGGLRGAGFKAQGAILGNHYYVRIHIGGVQRWENGAGLGFLPFPYTAREVIPDLLLDLQIIHICRLRIDVHIYIPCYKGYVRQGDFFQKFLENICCGFYWGGEQRDIARQQIF